MGYQVLPHSSAYTASETAHSGGIPGQQFIKPVIIKLQNKYVMCLLSANQLIDLGKLKKILSAPLLSLASEKEVQKLFF
ncbi:MAG TPA: YbaK/EbsC family protein, partial [Fusibacter sp.]|nr:YbaK/EbsC family protein [Fusibacter sp.]